MKRSWCRSLLGCLASVLTASVLHAAKPAPPPPGPTPTGTIYYTTNTGFWAMNADGTGKTLVSMSAAPGSRLNLYGTESLGLYGAPCDQVHGSDSKRDRWYLYCAPTTALDKIIYPNGAVRTATTLTKPNPDDPDNPIVT